jgi:hypothetical protein
MRSLMSSLTLIAPVCHARGAHPAGSHETGPLRERVVLLGGVEEVHGIADGNPWGSDPSTLADITFQATYVDGSVAWQS